jgi:hypothetical protein
MLSPTVVPLLKVERRPCSYSTDALLGLDLHEQIEVWQLDDDNVI